MSSEIWEVSPTYQNDRFICHPKWWGGVGCRVRDLEGFMDAMRLLAADGVQTLQPTEVEQFPPKGEDLPHAFFLLTGKATPAQQHA